MRGLDLCGYVAAGVQSDHESIGLDEGREKLRLGMWLWIREGSMRNMEALLPLVLEHVPDRAGFVSDDRTPSDLLRDGDLDYIIREAVKRGLPPISAIIMASLHPAHISALATVARLPPDIWLICWWYRTCAISVRGKSMSAEAGCRGWPALFTSPPLPQEWGDVVEKTIQLRDFGTERLRLPGQAGTARVIGLIPDQIVTDDRAMEVEAVDGLLQPDPARDLLKIAVVERYGQGRVGIGLLHGLGLKAGAMASSVAHDAHNIVVVGTNDADMVAAVREIERLQGGLVVTKDGASSINCRSRLAVSCRRCPLPRSLRHWNAWISW